MSMLTINRLVLLSEGATRLGVETKKMYSLIADGVLPPGVYVRIGRQLRINMPELETWIASGGSGFQGGWRKETR